MIREITLPGKGNVGGFGGKEDEKEMYYSFSNYITPGTTYKFNADSGKSEVYQKPKVKFNPEDYVSEQVFYTSKDGTKVPMMINYKKGTKLNGKNPTILYSYGGFNISLQPSFSVVECNLDGKRRDFMPYRTFAVVENTVKNGMMQVRKCKRKTYSTILSRQGEYLQSKGYTS